jgi:hypothetical protein
MCVHRNFFFYFILGYSEGVGLLVHILNPRVPCLFIYIHKTIFVGKYALKEEW